MNENFNSPIVQDQVKMDFPLFSTKKRLKKIAELKEEDFRYENSDNVQPDSQNLDKVDVNEEDTMKDYDLKINRENIFNKRKKVKNPADISKEAFDKEIQEVKPEKMEDIIVDFSEIEKERRPILRTEIKNDELMPSHQLLTKKVKCENKLIGELEFKVTNFVEGFTDENYSKEKLVFPTSQKRRKEMEMFAKKTINIKKEDEKEKEKEKVPTNKITNTVELEPPKDKNNIKLVDDNLNNQRELNLESNKKIDQEKKENNENVVISNLQNDNISEKVKNDSMALMDDKEEIEEKKCDLINSINNSTMNNVNNINNLILNQTLNSNLAMDPKFLPVIEPDNPFAVYTSFQEKKRSDLKNNLLNMAKKMRSYGISQDTLLKDNQETELISKNEEIKLKEKKDKKIEDNSENDSDYNPDKEEDVEEDINSEEEEMEESFQDEEEDEEEDESYNESDNESHYSQSDSNELENTIDKKNDILNATRIFVKSIIDEIVYSILKLNNNTHNKNDERKNIDPQEITKKSIHKIEGQKVEDIKVAEKAIPVENLILKEEENSMMEIAPSQKLNYRSDFNEKDGSGQENEIEEIDKEEDLEESEEENHEEYSLDSEEEIHDHLRKSSGEFESQNPFIKEKNPMKQNLEKKLTAYKPNLLQNNTNKNSEPLSKPIIDNSLENEKTNKEIDKQKSSVKESDSNAINKEDSNSLKIPNTNNLTIYSFDDEEEVDLECHSDDEEDEPVKEEEHEQVEDNEQENEEEVEVEDDEEEEEEKDKDLEEENIKEDDKNSENKTEPQLERKKLKKLSNLDAIKKVYNAYKNQKISIRDISRNKTLSKFFITEAELGSDNEENDNIIKPINKNDAEEDEDGLDDDLEDLIDNKFMPEENEDMDHFEELLEEELRKDTSEIAQILLGNFRKRNPRDSNFDDNLEFNSKMRIYEDNRKKIEDKEKMIFDLLTSNNIGKEKEMEDMIKNEDLSEDEAEKILAYNKELEMRKILNSIDKKFLNPIREEKINEDFEFASMIDKKNNDEMPRKELSRFEADKQFSKVNSSLSFSNPASSVNQNRILFNRSKVEDFQKKHEVLLNHFLGKNKSKEKCQIKNN